MTRNASGSSNDASARRASAVMSAAPCLLIITGSTTSGKANARALRATSSTIAESPSAPVLAAAGGMSPSTASSWAPTSEGESTSTASTLIVFWTVTRVRTASPYTPLWWNVFRSAWIPAPPEGSEPAMVRATGGFMGYQSSSPRRIIPAEILHDSPPL